MAYQLKTTGIATHLTTAIAVDPDLGVLTDLANASVAAGVALGTGCSVVDTTWNGVARKGVQLGSGNISFSTPYAFAFNSTTATRRSVFAIVKAAGGGTRAFGTDSSDYFAAVNTATGSGHPTIYHSSAYSGSFANPASGEFRIFGFTMVYNGATIAYTGKDSDTAMQSATIATNTISPVAWNLSYLGRRNDNSSQQADLWQALLIFDTDLAPSDVEALRADWFGTLFEQVAVGSSTADASITLDDVTLSASGSTTGNTSSTADATIALDDVTLTAAGTAQTSVALTLGPLYDAQGNLRANETGAELLVYDASTHQLVLVLTGQTTNASGILGASTYGLAAGSYRTRVVLADGTDDLSLDAWA